MPVMTTPPTLRDWQLQALRAWAANQYQGVIEAVTGAGKTMVGIHAIHRAVVHGGSALVLVPTVDLAFQWQAALVQWLGEGCGAGVLGGGSKATFATHKIVVSLVQSAYRHPIAPPDAHPFNTIVVDEAHRMGAESFGLALQPDWARRLGLTATWARPDMAHELILEPYFQRVVFSLGYSQAVNSGAVSSFDVHLVGLPMGADTAEQYFQLEQSMAGMRDQLRAMGALKSGGSWVGQISKMVRGTGTVAGIAGRYMKVYNSRAKLLGVCADKQQALVHLAPAVQAASRCVVFNQTVEATRGAAKILQGAGVDAEAFWGGMPKNKRPIVLQGFADGRPQTLCAPKVLDEGIDVPAADMGIIMAASASQRQMVQRMGRVIRPKEGRRARFLVLYLVGTLEDPEQDAHIEFLTQIRNSGAQVYTHILQHDDDASWATLCADLIRSATEAPEAPTTLPLMAN